MVASRAYRVRSGFALAHRAPDHGALTRNVLISGAAFAIVGLGSAGMALFGANDLSPTPYFPSRSALKVALAEPAAPQFSSRDPLRPVEMPGVTVAVKQDRLQPRDREAVAQKADKALVLQLSAARTPDPDITGSLGGDAPRPVKIVAVAPPPKIEPPVSLAPPKAVPVAAIAPKRPSRPLTPHEKLYGPVRLASLAPVNLKSDSGSALPGASYDLQTAVYVIGDKKVYMPDGSTLEAHSGLGDFMDDVRYVNVRMRGATPPHVYDMKMRESLFHGVEAIRLTPVGGEEAIFNRAGLLAHPYMLGPNGQSNGCVSFKDYSAFLQAFKAGRISRLAVIAKLD